MKRGWRMTPSEIISLLVIGATKKRGAGIAVYNNTGDDVNYFIVKLTDSPAEYESLEVTVNKVEALHKDKGWIELDNKSRSIDLLSLANGVEAEIAAKPNPDPGLYTRLRISFAQDARLKLNSFATGNTVALNWENGLKEAEIEINVQVDPGKDAEVLLHFNTAVSIKKHGGKYSIKPVITEVSNPGTGVRGRVMFATSATLVLTDGKMQYSTNTDGQGNFLFRGIKQGVYKMIITPGRQAIGGHSAKKEINGVIIIENEVKQMGEISL